MAISGEGPKIWAGSKILAEISKNPGRNIRHSRGSTGFAGAPLS
jgi:hypothetical protein